MNTKLLLVAIVTLTIQVRVVPVVPGPPNKNYRRPVLEEVPLDGAKVRRVRVLHPDWNAYWEKVPLPICPSSANSAIAIPDNNNRRLPVVDAVAVADSMTLADTDAIPVVSAKASRVSNTGTSSTVGNKPTKPALERLEEIRLLLDRGLISDAEYDTKRAEILESVYNIELFEIKTSKRRDSQHGNDDEVEE